MPALSVADQERFRVLMAGARAGVVASLRQRGDAASHAVALLIAAGAAFEAVRHAEGPAARALCGDDAACVDRTMDDRAARSGAGVLDVDALLRLAAASRDPFVHAVALDACTKPWSGAGRPSPSCDAVSGAQWAAIEPGNAVAWIHAAAAASAAGDPSGVETALIRASRATSSRLHGDSLYGLVTGTLPEGAPEAGRTAAHFVASDVVASWALPPYTIATQWCGASQVRDPNRRQHCTDLAEHLAERGRTMIDLGIGIAIARRIDPQSSRVAAWTERRDALMHAMLAPAADRDAKGCAPIAAEQSFLARASTVGETSALAERLDAAGLKPAEAASRMRLERKARVAAAAASSLPAASAPR